MDELMANRLKAADESLPIRASRSKRGMAGKNLSTGDVDALKQILEDNPGIDLQAASELLQQARSARGSAYRINAAMDKVGVQ